MNRLTISSRSIDMVSSSWWRASANEISQGDVFRDVPFILPIVPHKPLIEQPLPGGSVRGYVEAIEPKIKKGESKAKYLADGNKLPVALINYGCDIDKEFSKRLIVSPVRLLTEYNQEIQELIMKQSMKHALLLPDVPDLGDAVIDLRVMSIVSKDYLQESNRISSMTDEALLRFQAQILMFFTRIDLNEITN